MANILYGINGEGSGHSTRAKDVISHLQNQGHKLHLVSFDRGFRNLRENFPVTEIFGFRITYINNRVRYKRTVASNLIKAPKAARSLKDLSRLVEENNIELVITDFEPLTCHVGHRKGLPVIAIDNQHAITNTRVSLPHGFQARHCRGENGDAHDDAACRRISGALVFSGRGKAAQTRFFFLRSSARKFFPPRRRPATTFWSM